jgi:hypothetical protein
MLKERPSARPLASSILIVAHAWVRGERSGHQWLSRAAVAAPRTAEFEQRRSGQLLDFLATWPG